MDGRQVLGLGVLGALAALLGGVAWMSLAGPDTGPPAARPVAAEADDRGFVAKGHRPDRAEDRRVAAPTPPRPETGSPAWVSLRNDVHDFEATPPTLPPLDDDAPPEVEDERWRQMFSTRAAQYAELQERLLAEAAGHPPNEGEVWVELAELRLAFASDVSELPTPSYLTPEQAEVYTEGTAGKAEAQREAAAEAIAQARTFAGKDDPLSARLDRLAARLE
jgi:hypothetical protein